ncbi:MAG: hypothetical protein ACREDO_03090, partial [Methyloceanibacter sp.]
WETGVKGEKIYPSALYLNLARGSVNRFGVVRPRDFVKRAWGAQGGDTVDGGNAHCLSAAVVLRAESWARLWCRPSLADSPPFFSANLPKPIASCPRFISAKRATMAQAAG